MISGLAQVPVGSTLGAVGGGSATAQSVPEPRLVRASHEFEAQMMKELLQPLAAKSSLPGDDDEDDSGSGNAMAAYATESLGRALSEQGGLGLSHQIIQELSRRGNAQVTGSVTGNLHSNTVLKGLK
jgi:Rod binding domain-containing protein